MVINDLMDSVKKLSEKEAQTVAGRTFVQGMCAAAAVGLATGALFALSMGRRTRKKYKKMANSALTIEVHDLEKLGQYLNREDRIT